MSSAPTHREVENLPLLVFSIMLATLMQVLDATIANVALPHMQGSLSATQDQAAWVLTSYIVAAAIATPATGWLSGHFGRKRLLLASITGFVLASVLCATASSIDQMVAYRVLQGLFGASLVPISQSSLLDSFPPEKHGAAMALWGMGVVVGPILGPPLGGWLTEDYSWHWVFLINVPLGIIALLGVMASMPTDAHQPTRFDLRGLVLIAIGIGSLQLFLDRGNLEDWLSSTEIRIELALALLGLYLYFVHWRARKNPFVDLALLRDRNFGAANLFIFILSVVLFASMALLPPYMQNLMDYPVITTGMLLAPRGLGTMVAMILVGRILARGVDPRLPAAVGIVLTTVAMWMMSQWNADVPMWLFINTGVIQGLGLGLVFVPISTMAYTTLPMAVRTEAASIYSLVRNIGSSIGISIVFTVVARYTQINHAEIVTHLTPYGIVPLPANLTDSRGLILLNEMVTRQAAAIGYINDFILMTWLTLAMLPLLLLFRVPRRPRAAAGQVVTASSSESPMIVV